MKKIAYIELDTHAETASNFMELMRDSDEFSVEYFFSGKILKLLNLAESPNIFNASAENILEKLSEKKYDLVIIGTVHRYFGVFDEVCQKFNTASICHNLNFSKIKRSRLFLNIFKKDTAYRLKLLLKENLLSAPNVYQKARTLLVLDQNLALNKDFTFLPVFFSKDFHVEKKSIFTLAIPGAVSQKRRDYAHIFREIKRMKPNIPIRFIFIGKAENEELAQLKNLQSEVSPKIYIEYFTEKVPQNIFDEKMKSAQVLWCPIQKETEFFSQTEIYGETKMSGNIGDAIKYKKLAIFPENFKTNYPFLIPENEDIAAQFFSLENNSCDFEKDFGKEKVRADLELVLSSLT